MVWSDSLGNRMKAKFTTKVRFANTLQKFIANNQI